MGNAGATRVTEEEKEIYKQNFEEACKQAAETIKSADILLLATGAGFSADSGLAVYKDIADIEAYHKMKLKYHDICQPHWLKQDPEIFYGFWGMCFNDYRKTTPHEGYSIVKKWKNNFFTKDTAKYGDQIATTYDQFVKVGSSSVSHAREDKWKTNSGLPIHTTHNRELPLANSFFVFTSNVDAHSVKAGFSPNEVYEIHGTTELWQCARSCEGDIWSAPPNFLFEVDKKTMRAPSKAETKASEEEKEEKKEEEKKEEEKTEKEKEDKTKLNGFIKNHPVCKHDCGALARPAILMFGDFSFIEDTPQTEQYRLWKKVIHKIQQSNTDFKMAIVEIGCGINVPTVRLESQSWLQSLPKGTCTLIRINPDFPKHGLEKTFDPYVIGINTSGLVALREIDKHMVKKETDNRKAEEKEIKEEIKEIKEEIKEIEQEIKEEKKD